MSFDVNWDISKYRDDHESDEQWQLRSEFMEKWKNRYPEERLVCLARVFANIEFMGCRYPTEVMQEVASLSQDIAKSYRQSKKGKLQRTFVSASTAAEDRARGIKRKGGVIDNPRQSKKIQFIPQGQQVDEDISDDSGNESTLINNFDANTESNKNVELKFEKQDLEAITVKESSTNQKEAEPKSLDSNLYGYKEELLKIRCLHVRSFRENMFHTTFGKLVLLIRPWVGKLSNIQASCQACGLQARGVYENGTFIYMINDTIIEQAPGFSKLEAKSVLEAKLWERLSKSTISVLVKEQWIAQNESRISVSDVSSKKTGQDAFGTPVENTVAVKMMKMMGWKGGGLGADAQGIAEPIKPNLQLVNRAGLGSTASNAQEMRRAGSALMRRYLASDTLDLDLVFSAEFSKEERATLHLCAQKAGLVSRSYGTGDDRFLVVRKRLDPFSLVRAVIEKGGSTPKYQVFIPDSLRTR